MTVVPFRRERDTTAIWNELSRYPVGQDSPRRSELIRELQGQGVVFISKPCRKWWQFWRWL
jgi:endonuclease I